MPRLLAILPLLTLMSCATVLSGKHENIIVNSDPPGADATLTCSPGTMQRGVTPVTLTIERRSENCKLVLKRDGFANETVVIEQGINGKYWINFSFTPLVPAGLIGIFGFFGEPTNSDKTIGTALLLTALAGFTVDRLTGAIHDHHPARIDVSLKRRE